MKYIIPLTFFLASCSTSQLTQAEQAANAAVNAVAASCAIAEQDAAAASTITGGGAAQSVAQIQAYLTAACGSANAIIAIAQNPGTTAWLAQLAQDFQAISTAIKPTS